MANIRQLILDKLETALNLITTANGYNTTVTKVVAGLILDPNSYSSSPAVLLQTRYRGQSNSRTGDHWNTARAEYPLVVSMLNCTHEAFLALLDDIEAVISKNVYGIAGAGYRLGYAYITDCRVTSGNEQDFDEVMGDSGQYKELRAMITILAEYEYIPELLSG